MGNHLNFLGFPPAKGKTYRYSFWFVLMILVILQTACGAINRFFDDLQKENPKDITTPTVVYEPDLLIKPLKLQYEMKFQGESEEDIASNFQLFTKFSAQYAIPQKNIQFTYPKSLKLKFIKFK